MEDDRSLLAELGIDPDAVEPPMNVLASALAAAFDPTTPPVEGVVPVVDDEPHVPANNPGQTIDLGDDTHDAPASSAAAPHSHARDTDAEPLLDDDPDLSHLDAGEDHSHQHHLDLGGHHDDGPSLDH